MADLIPHSRPTLPSDSEWSEVTSQLHPGWAADGPCLREFEARASGWLGRTEGVAVSSGTTALQLALTALGIGAGAEVLIPAYACAALLSAVSASGASPVLVDSEAGGFLLSAEDASRKITPRTRAVVVCHLFGHPAPLDDFLALGVPVIEDCAQTLGARAGGTHTGARGRAAMTSFFATKVISTGQGGLVTGDEEVIANVRDLVEYDGRDDWKPRLSCRMGELPAALGLWQLERLPGFLRRRAEIAAFYDRELNGFNVRPEPAPADVATIAYRYVIRVPNADEAIAGLQSRGVDAKRPVYRPLHHYLNQPCPEAQRCHESLVSLPIYPTLTDGEAEKVAAAARSLLGYTTGS